MDKEVNERLATELLIGWDDVRVAHIFIADNHVDSIKDDENKWDKDYGLRMVIIWGFVGNYIWRWKF